MQATKTARERTPSQRKGLTPEADYLLACARSVVGSSSGNSGRTNVDSDRLHHLALRHGVLGLLPAPSAMEFGQQVRQNFALVSELRKLWDAFQTAKVPVLPLKGPVLAVTLYGDVAARASSDIDLLIRPAHLQQAADVLCAAGYRLHSTLPKTNRQSSLHLNKENELCFLRPSDGMCVDLHGSLLPHYFPQPVLANDLWRRSRIVSIAGCEIASLDDEDQLLYLCAHGTKHQWERLSWICDVAMLVQHRRGLEWDEVLRRASLTEPSRSGPRRAESPTSTMRFEPRGVTWG